MRKLLLRTLFFLVPFLYSIYVSSQPADKPDCAATCFSSEVISATKISENCTSYELKVSYAGVCAHALSHFSVEIPCGALGEITNSENWKQEIGTDPVTGIRGFKIDDISGFGEGSLTSFTVRFNICTSGEDCATALTCWQPRVAYKAANCINYETLDIACPSLKASLRKQDVSCHNANDGSLSVEIAEGQEPYTFLWSDNSTGASLSGLAAGTYSVIVRDRSGSEITLEETIAQPQAISISGVATPASCNGVANGAIELTVAGGIAPFTFSWNNEQTTEDLHNIVAGQYAVTATDANNCSATARFTVGSLSRIGITGVSKPADCNEANGALDLTIWDGTAPYTFIWSDGVTTQNRTDIKAGLYTVTVTDNSGCSEKASFVVRDKNTLVVKEVIKPAGCGDEPSGAIDLTVTGGTEPYTYAWSHNGETTQDLTDVPSGNYSVTITDANGCNVTRYYTVTKSTFLIQRAVQQPTCYNEGNGSITLQEPIGGTGPFTYVWSDGKTGTVRTDLAPGTYSVTVTDAAGCSRTLTTIINNPSEIIAYATVTSPECNGEGSFSIDLTTSGGTAPYAYAWSDGSTTEDRADLQPGAYTVVITDAHGCTASKEILVEGTSPAWACLIDGPSANPVCGSEGNTLATTVADADSYAWTVESTDNYWSISGQNTPSISFTAGGENSTATFTLTMVKDGCTKTCTYTVSACTPQSPDTGGGDEPGTGEPGEELPGEDPGTGIPGDGDDGNDNGGNQDCSTCFESTAIVVNTSGACRTYEVRVNTNGLCRHDLSHWTLAIPCGAISNYSNSEGWSMEIGQDPTTGLSGLKVDGIIDFGKKADSFTVRFTLCETTACDLSLWSPAVAYKAGQCIETEPVKIDDAVAALVSVYPNPFNELVNFEWTAIQPNANLQIIDQYGNTVSTITDVTRRNEKYHVTLESSALPKGMYYYRLTIDGNTYHGKISRR